MTIHPGIERLRRRFATAGARVLLSALRSRLGNIIYVAIVSLPVAIGSQVIRRRMYLGLSPGSVKRKLSDYAEGYRPRTNAWNERLLIEFKEIADSVRRVQAETTAPHESLVDKAAEIEDQTAAMLIDAIQAVDRTDEEGLRQVIDTVISSAAKANQIRSFAIAVEAIHRALGIVLREEQLVAGVALSQEYFIEMKNGTGKTFAAVLPAANWAISMRALKRACRELAIEPPYRSVFVLTANDYLVRRDFAWLGPVFRELGITTGYIVSQMTPGERSTAYSSDLIYMTAQEFGFDYLRNQCRQIGSLKLNQSPYVAVIDEADQILLDEANSPLILSGQSPIQFSSRVSPAWVSQIDFWVRDIFLPNTLIDLDSNGRGSLSRAGALFVRQITPSDLEWSSLFHSDLVTLICLMLRDVMLASWPTASQDDDGLSRMARTLNHCESVLRFDPATALWSLTDSATADIDQIFKSFGTWLQSERWSFVPVLKWMIRELSSPSAGLSPEDKRWLRSIGRRRAVSLAYRVTTPDFWIRTCNSFINHLMAEPDLRMFDPRFVDGVHSVLVRDEPDSLSAAAWLSEELAPLSVSLITSSSAGLKVGGAASSDLPVILKLYGMFGRVSATEDQGPLVRRAIEGSVWAAAFTSNFLYHHMSGKLTAAGRRVAQALVEVCSAKGLIEGLGSELALIDLIERSLHAYVNLWEGRDYIVRDRRVELVNRITGRPEPSKHFGRSLHGFVQAKHGLSVEEQVPTRRTISMPNVIRRFPKMAGMSGTLTSEDRELRLLYGRKRGRQEPFVLEIPEAVPANRAILPSRLCGRNQSYTIDGKAILGRWDDLAQEAIDIVASTGQPVLVLASSVTSSDEIASRLREMCIARSLPSTVRLLNARYQELEEEVITHAGEIGAISVATQMACRGTDICVASDALRRGGLFVIIERIEKIERLDRQALGRCARNGEPGVARFYSSLDDPVCKDGVFKPAVNIFSKFIRDVGGSIEVGSSLDRQIAQVRAEQAVRDVTLRQTVLQSDEILHWYRQSLDSMREAFLDTSDLPYDHIRELAGRHLQGSANMYRYQRFSDAAEYAQKKLQSLGGNASDLSTWLTESSGVTISAERCKRVIADLASGEPAADRTRLEDFLVSECNREDLGFVQAEWSRLCVKFNILTDISEWRYFELIELLNRQLMLGLDAASVSERMAKKMRSFSPYSGSAPDILRAAILETMRFRNLASASSREAVPRLPELLLGDKAARLGSTPPMEDEADATDALLDEFMVRIRRLPEPIKFSIRQKFVTEFDKQFEQALDDIEILERQLPIASTLDEARYAVARDVADRLGATQDELARKFVQILEDVRADQPTQHPDHSHRFLRMGVIGESALASSGKSQIQRWIPPRGRASPSALEHVSSNARASTSATSATPARSFTAPAIASPGENDSSRLSAHETGWRFVRNARGDEGNLLGELIRLEEQVASGSADAHLAIASVYRQFDCSEKEKTLLSDLENQKPLPTRARLRLVNLLYRGSQVDRMSATNILLNEQFLEDLSNEYSERATVPFVANYLLAMEQFGACLDFLMTRSHLFLPPSLESIEIYKILARALRRLSREAKESYVAKLSDAQVWGTRLLVSLEAAMLATQTPAPDLIVSLATLAIVSEEPAAAARLMGSWTQSPRQREAWSALSQAFSEIGAGTDKDLTDAMLALDSEDYETAGTIARTVLRAAPGDLDATTIVAVSLLGELRALSNTSEAAKEKLIELEQICPTTPSLGRDNKPSLAEAEVAIYARRFEDALSMCEALDSNSWDAERIEAQAKVGVVINQEPLQFCDKTFNDLLSQLEIDSFPGSLAVISSVSELLIDQEARSADAWINGRWLPLIGSLLEFLQTQLNAKRVGYGQYKLAARLHRLVALYHRAKHSPQEEVVSLKHVVDLLDSGLELTRQQEAPFSLILTRDERLEREIMEVELRNSLKRIKEIEVNTGDEATIRDD